MKVVKILFYNRLSGSLGLISMGVYLLACSMSAPNLSYWASVEFLLVPMAMIGVGLFMLSILPVLKCILRTWPPR